MNRRIVLLCWILLLTGCTLRPQTAAPLPTPSPFSGERAYEDVKYQVNLGPRTPGSEAHQQAVAWMQAELTKAGWQVSLQETTYRGQPVRNVIAERAPSNAAPTAETPWLILGAHFDSRLKADQDPDPANRSKPVPAANDGASGVAVLLELARTLPPTPDLRIGLAFFDQEDQGDLPGYDWILGSSAMAEMFAAQTPKPAAVVVIDMIGDANLNIKRERTSTAALSQSIWQTAKDLGYTQSFIDKPGYAMLDDHTPFLRAQIPAVDLIDFDYPYWHTLGDTPEQVSAQSLETIGKVLTAWITQPTLPEQLSKLQP